MKSTAVRLWATKLVIQPADEFRDRSVANHFVHNIVAPLLAGDPEKLRVSARNDVLRAFAQNEEAPDSRRRVVDGNDHLGRGKTLIGAALVRGECRRVNREGKVFLLKTRKSRSAILAERAGDASKC